MNKLHTEKELEVLRTLVRSDLKLRQKRERLCLTMNPDILESLKKDADRLQVKISPLVESILMNYLNLPEMLIQEEKS